VGHTLAVAAVGAVLCGAAPAAASVQPYAKPCRKTFVVGSTYTVGGFGLDASDDPNAMPVFSAPTAEECTTGAAALEEVVRSASPVGESRTIGTWSCRTDATGGTCTRFTPARSARVDAVCELAGGGGEDDDDPDGPDDDAPKECLLAGNGAGAGGGSGSGAGSGTGGGSEAAAARTFVVDRRGTPRSAPRTLALPRSVRGTGLRWAGWGGRTAVGRGRVATSGRSARTGRITMSSRRTCADGRRVYTRATAKVAGRTVRLTRPGCSALRG
jgi:hypothetical protein